MPFPIKHQMSFNLIFSRSGFVTARKTSINTAVSKTLIKTSDIVLMPTFSNPLTKTDITPQNIPAKSANNDPFNDFDKTVTLLNRYITHKL